MTSTLPAGKPVTSDQKAVKPNLQDMFFEGPEKTLEILFVNQEDSISLRKGISQAVWSEILKLVNCEILSKVSDAYQDAYMLSESSLFVSDNRIILKTCGTTTLLCAIYKILEVARDLCKQTAIADLWYSRRNYFESQKQLTPHGTWKSEVDFLNKIIKGSAYILGSTTDVHWFLFVTDTEACFDSTSEGLPTGTPMPIHATARKAQHSYPSTFEVLMHDLDPAIARQFFRQKGTSSVETEASQEETRALSKEVTKRSGIASLVPNSVIDDFLFDPCGYSMNGLLDGHYWTIHITPQPSCSYASFETDVPSENFGRLLSKILPIFRPGSFTVSIIAHHADRDNFQRSISGLQEAGELAGFTSLPRVSLSLNNSYDIWFATFRERHDPLPQLSATFIAPAIMAKNPNSDKLRPSKKQKLKSNGSTGLICDPLGH